MKTSSVKREADDDMHAGVELLTRSADRMAKRSEHTVRDAVLMLLTTATVNTIRKGGLSNDDLSDRIYECLQRSFGP